MTILQYQIDKSDNQANKNNKCGCIYYTGCDAAYATSPRE